MICPAPREATRLTRIWDKGRFMSLARKEKREKKQTGEEKTKKTLKEIKETFVIYDVGDCFFPLFYKYNSFFLFKKLGLGYC